MRRLSDLTVLLTQPLWVVFGFGLSAALVVGLLGDRLSADGPNQLLLGLLVNALIYGLALAVTVVVPLLVLRRPASRLKDWLALRQPPRWSHLGRAGVMFGFYLLASVAVSLLASALLVQFGYDPEQKQEIGITPDGLTHVYQYLLALIMLVVLPPLFEELLFRGYLYGRLRSRFSFWVAALVSSAAFGLVHGQWNVALDTFVLGLFLCHLREHFDSIWPAVFLHAIKNGLAFSLLFIVRIQG